MSFLSVHLEQIQLCCEGINSLPFPQPRIFTNALLANHDITSLIRDTEPHERALFSVPPTKPSLADAPKDATSNAASSKSRRQTVFNVASGEVTTGPLNSRAAPRRNTTVAAVLGSELHDQLRGRPRGVTGGNSGNVDLEILLKGAEKLCKVYALPGASTRIAQIRQRHETLANTMAYYENKVAEQSLQLEEMNRNWMDEVQAEEEERQANDGMILTEEDLKAVEVEVRELEKKKAELQAQLQNMKNDIGGLNAMDEGGRRW
ncbi:hypothetical protein TD95_002829 [Thielaviopsis punctulata]|uniref:DASH complex subunit SPC34 n=1 Tax=Thielaviopsis punctulata TaxID=72032 RepID=A0A0F4ZE60_9PEZI|nr:hypothetical protein TD95_002829 [Thielaviopsis punctulata]